jgi:hypothetical protein
VRQPIEPKRQQAPILAYGGRVHVPSGHLEHSLLQAHPLRLCHLLLGRAFDRAELPEAVPAVFGQKSRVARTSRRESISRMHKQAIYMARSI